MPPVPLAPGDRTGTRLVLAEEPAGPAYAAQWIGQLVALGAQAWGYQAQLPGEQLVIAITVPRRDFAAALVSCGWVIAHPAPQLSPPIDILRQLSAGTVVRLVTDRYVVTSQFLSLNELKEPARVYMHGSGWLVNKIEALGVLSTSTPSKPERAERPSPGIVGRFADLDDNWAARLAAPAADLAIIGTLAWLREDVRAYISLDGTDITDLCQLSTLLLPEGMQAATWSTRLYSSARFDDQLPLPTDIQGVVLDGFGAIRYLADIGAPVAICIIDRWIANEAAAEIIVQIRNAGSTPIPMRDLGWLPVPGIEALAFTVPL